MSWPILWAARRNGQVPRVARGLAAGISIALGTVVLVDLLVARLGS
jgi:hypothetical protein